MYVFVCLPDRNGVYEIDGRYVNVKSFNDPDRREFDRMYCRVCSALQEKPYDGRCVVCGYDMFRSSAEDRERFIEENSERIEDLKKNYGRENNGKNKELYSK